MNALTNYDQMRVAVRDCAVIDEAKQIKNKAEALEFYARQANDRELEVWVAEIKLRAEMRIGELTQELEQQRAPGRLARINFPAVGSLRPKPSRTPI